MPMVCCSMRVRRAVVRVTVRHYDYDCSAMEVAKVLLSDPEKGSLQWRGTTTGTIRWWGPSMPTPHLHSHNFMPSTDTAPTKLLCSKSCSSSARTESWKHELNESRQGRTRLKS
jgi:hypothetical protein